MWRVGTNLTPVHTNLADPTLSEPLPGEPHHGSLLPSILILLHRYVGERGPEEHRRPRAGPGYVSARPAFHRPAGGLIGRSALTEKRMAAAERGLRASHAHLFTSCHAARCWPPLRSVHTFDVKRHQRLTCPCSPTGQGLSSNVRTQISVSSVLTPG